MVADLMRASTDAVTLTANLRRDRAGEFAHRIAPPSLAVSAGSGNARRFGSLASWLTTLTLVQLNVPYPWLANGSGGSILIGILAILDACAPDACPSRTRAAPATLQSTWTTITVVTPETLYRMKRDTVRLRDRDDAQRLARAFGFGSGEEP